MIETPPPEFQDEAPSPQGMTQSMACQLAAAMGLKMFSTNLYLPKYRQGTVGRWRLTRGGFNVDRGYYSGLCGVWGMPALLRDADGDGKTWETWMSLSPMEIESQDIAPRHAHGHAVVMGLGMGWVAINIALNPAVSRVSVIERDPDVIALFAWSNALEGLPSEVTDKIDIIQADALEWRAAPERPVDFLYADIWGRLDEPQTLDDVRRMQGNVSAQAIYYWGQELALDRLLASQMPADCTPDQGVAAIRHCMDTEIALPLLLPADMDYVDFIRQVASQWRLRWPQGTPA